jgi:hypothetical protein
MQTQSLGRNVRRTSSMVRGWMSPNAPCLPVEGEVFFLKTAFIDQAMALRRKSHVTYLESVSPSSASFIPMGGRQAHAKLTTQRR